MCCTRGEKLSVEEAMNYVGGYCVVLDLTGGNLGTSLIVLLRFCVSCPRL